MGTIKKKSEEKPFRRECMKDIGIHRCKMLAYWDIEIDSDEVLSRVTRDSNYREHVMSDGGEKYVLMEDDRALFFRFFRSAVSELWLKLGRMSKRVPEGIRYSDDCVRIRLEVGRNHDDNMMFSLIGFIDDFLDAFVLKEWYVRNSLDAEALKCAQSADAALSNVVTVVHYRKRPVRRPIDPLF